MEVFLLSNVHPSAFSLNIEVSFEGRKYRGVRENEKMDIFSFMAVASRSWLGKRRSSVIDMK